MTQQQVIGPIFPLDTRSDYDKMYCAIKLYISVHEVFSFLDCDDDSQMISEVSKMKLPVENKCIKVLSYLMLKGISDSTIKDCREELKMDKQSWTQIISHLTTRGYLIKDSFNQTRRHFDKDLEAYCRAVMNYKENSGITIRF